MPLALPHLRLWPTWPLWYPPPFYDFGCYYERLQLLHTPRFWTADAGATWDYPAPDVWVYKLFYAFNRGHGGTHKVFFGFLAYLTFAAGVLAAAGAGLAKSLRRRGVSVSWAVALAATLPLCWPVFFGMQRGNIEFFLDAGVALGVWCYAKRKFWPAAVLIGAFGTGKLYPLLLLGLLLPERRRRELAAGLGVAAAVTLLATHWIGPAPIVDHHAHGIWSGLTNWVRANSMGWDWKRSGFDHSLFGAVKFFMRNHLQRFAVVALGCDSLLALLLLGAFLWRVWGLPRLNQLVVLSAGAVLLPPSSFDYTLMLLVPAWAWLALLSTQETRRPRPLCWAMVLLAILFAPETFATWHGYFFAAQVKWVCLLALVTLACAVPFDDEARVRHRSD